MALADGSLIEVSVVGQLNGQVSYNVFQHSLAFYPTGVTAVELGEAFWNHVKTVWRPIVAATQLSAFQLVRVREMSVADGAFGEYAIPLAEQPGTQAVGSSDTVPPFVAAGVRLTVGTRVTRPGQKRFGGLIEANIENGSLLGGYVTLLTALMGVLSNDMLLGAPALAAVLRPMVVRKDSTTGLPTASQAVTGFLINPYATSQVSRKVGRGI